MRRAIASPLGHNQPSNTQKITLMKKNLISLLTIALLFTLSACSDDGPIVPVPGDDYVSAAQYLKDIDFSGSVLIRKGRTDVLRSGFGFADRSANELNQVDHVFRIGSMTKSFTAMGIVHLKRDGLIHSYDQPISDFIDDFDYSDQITLRHLLNHSSGIPDYFGPVEEFVATHTQYLSPDDILEVITDLVTEEGLLFEAGTQHSYSNSNYMMLGLLIEDLTGMTYHEYLKLKMLDPLGLTHTGKGPDNMSGAPYAKGYDDEGEVAPYQMQIAFSAGDMISTIGDMEKWGDALLGDQFLTVAEKADIFADPVAEEGFYSLGFGWFTMREEGNLMYFHGGDIDGYSSLIALLPETNSMIVVLGNEEDGGENRNLIQETLVKYEFQ